MSQNILAKTTSFVNKKQVIDFFDVVLKFYCFMFSWKLYNRLDADDKYIVIGLILLAFINKKLKKKYIMK